MKTTIKHLFVSTVLAAALSTGASLYAANDTKPVEKAKDTATKSAEKVKETTTKAADQVKGAAAEVKAKRDWYPFHGIVSSVNKQANTISLKKVEGERVLKLDAKSELEINGKTTTSIANVKVGNYAHGKLHKDKAGEEVIMSAGFEKEAPAKPDKADADEPRANAPEKAATKTPAAKAKPGNP